MHCAWPLITDQTRLYLYPFSNYCKPSTRRCCTFYVRELTKRLRFNTFCAWSSAAWNRRVHLHDDGGCRCFSPSSLSLYETLNAFQWAEKKTDPQKFPLPMVDLEYMVPWAHTTRPSKPHLDQFSSSCKAHECDQQTDCRSRYSVCNNRPHLATAAICGLQRLPEQYTSTSCYARMLSNCK